MGKTSGPSGQVRVVVRCRPLHPDLERDHTQSRLTVSDDVIVVRDDNCSEDGGSVRKFTFDRVLDSSSTQTSAFTEVAPLIDHVLNGFHATVFAYGQTGSGKTYTMEGLNYRTVNFSRKHDASTANRSAIPDLDTPASQHGITFRTIQLLFDKARERQGAGPASTNSAADEANDDDDDDGEEAAELRVKGDVQYRFKCSFYQIYNEKVTDLLNTSKNKSRNELECGLRLRWRQGDTFAVENLFYYECDTPEKMREAFFRGAKEKEVSGHLMNHQSSRSHCVFTIYVERTKPSTGELQSRSEFSIVDLAGSERLGSLATNPSARLVKESIDINTSLLALGKVITALSVAPGAKKASTRGGGGRAAASHVPYRDSKLTKLLKHALGGNSITVMFACISPSDKYIEETVSTLLYAGRAKNIQNAPHVNQDPTAALIRQLKGEISQLKRELQYYRSLATESIALREETAAKQVAEAGEGKELASTGGDGNAATPTASNAKAEELADSLLSACAMLKQVMEVNGELRDAYDTIKAAKEAADRHEVQLNAENIALRERIQVLESIVLTDGFAHAKQQQEEEEEDEVEEENVMVKPDARALQPSRAVAKEAVPSSSETLASKASSNPESKPSRKAALSSTADTHDSKSNNKSRNNGVAEDNSKDDEEEAPQVISSTSEVIVDEQSGRRVVRRRRVLRRKKPNKKIVRRLEEYEQKYRDPRRPVSYEEYYSRAETEAGRSVVSQKANEFIKELDKKLKKIPGNLVSDFVPASLRSSKRFGSLAFGGAPEDTKTFESRRRSRDARRAELLRKQQSLYSMIDTDIQTRNFGPIDPEIPPPPPLSSSSPPAAGSAQGGERAGTSGSTPAVTTSASISGGEAQGDFDLMRPPLSYGQSNVLHMPRPPSQPAPVSCPATVPLSPTSSNAFNSTTQSQPVLSTRSKGSLIDSLRSGLPSAPTSMGREQPKQSASSESRSNPQFSATYGASDLRQGKKLAAFPSATAYLPLQRTDVNSRTSAFFQSPKPWMAHAQQPSSTSSPSSPYGASLPTTGHQYNVTPPSGAESDFSRKQKEGRQGPFTENFGRLVH